MPKRKAVAAVKTVMIYDQLDASIKFLVLDGDYKHLDGIYINASDQDEKLQDELSNLLYDPQNGQDRVTLLTEFPTQAVRDGAEVIIAGFLP